MAREFWEVFLPRDITVYKVKWSGAKGRAEIDYSYSGSTRVFRAIMIRSLAPNSPWHLDEIVELQ